MNWLDNLMQDVDRRVDEAMKNAANAHASGPGQTVVVQSGGGTYVNGKKVDADRDAPIDIVNGQIYINGKRAD